MSTVRDNAAGDAAHFPWTRPREMSMPAFRDFTAEAEASVGPANAGLLAIVDAALNDPCAPGAYLSMDEASARAFAESRPEGADAAMRTLALVHELAYRKAHGPRIWERKSGVVPCPGFLPPTPHQVRAGSMGLYRAANVAWNIAFIFSIYGAFPAVGSLVRRGLRASTRPLWLWFAALAAFAGARFLCGALRGRRRTTGSEASK